MTTGPFGFWGLPSGPSSTRITGFNLNIHENVTKTQAVIRELNHVGLGNGGELAHSLSGLVYFDSRLQEANISKNKEIIEEILQRISDLRDAWADRFNNKPKPPNSRAPPPCSVPAPRPGTAQFNRPPPPTESPGLLMG